MAGDLEAIGAAAVEQRLAELDCQRFAAQSQHPPGELRRVTSRLRGANEALQRLLDQYIDVHHPGRRPA